MMRWFCANMDHGLGWYDSKRKAVRHHSYAERPHARRFRDGYYEALGKYDGSQDAPTGVYIIREDLIDAEGWDWQRDEFEAREAADLAQIARVRATQVGDTE